MDIQLACSRLQNTGGGVACLREALALCEHTNNVSVKQDVLRNLINMSSGLVGYQAVSSAEADALRSRLNHLSVQTGRDPDTSCVICQDLLVKDAAGDSGPGEAGSDTGETAVRVLRCGHQFHQGCLGSWFRTASSQACPTCRKLNISDLPSRVLGCSTAALGGKGQT